MGCTWTDEGRNVGEASSKVEMAKFMSQWPCAQADHVTMNWLQLAMSAVRVSEQ